MEPKATVLLSSESSSIVEDRGNEAVANASFLVCCLALSIRICNISSFHHSLLAGFRASSDVRDAGVDASLHCLSDARRTCFLP